MPAREHKGIRKPREYFKPLIECSARTINKHKGKDVQFLVLDRDARPLYQAMKKADLDAKLVPLTVKLTPYRFGKKMYEKISQHVDFSSETEHGSKHWLETNKKKHEKEAAEIMKKHDYFKNHPLTKDLMKHLDKKIDKKKKIIVLDTSFKGTIAVYLAHLLKKKGFEADWDIVLHNAKPKKLRASFHNTKMLETKTEKALKEVEKITDVPGPKKPESQEAKEYERISKAISDEIAKKIKEKSRKKLFKRK